MKKENLSDALGEVDERFIEEALPKKKRGSGWIKWTSAVAAVLAVSIGIVAVLGHSGTTPIVAGAHAVVEANYPKMAQYPSSRYGYDYSDKDYSAWRDSKAERAKYYGSSSELGSFMEKTVSEFLSGSKDGNRIYSPVNVYMALCMLAEITDGNSRAQILSLIGVKDIKSLREQAYAVWNANYCDDGSVTSVLANSVWLSDKITYNENTLKTVAEKYFASSFSGQMGSDEYTKMLRDWLNKQTGGLLSDKISGVELDPQTVIALASTIYFRAKWDAEFYEKETKQGVFHEKNGDVTVDFMNQTMWYGQYYYGKNFSATTKQLEESGEMRFILPDEGVTVDDLLSDGEALSFIAGNTEAVPSKLIRINLSVPKFDVDSKFDLSAGLKDLGVSDVFDIVKSDFSPLTDSTKAYVTSAEHSARVAIDEEGVIAAAYTVMVMAGAAEPPKDEIDFVVDRPFIFVITSVDGTPLFVGVVNTVK